MRATASPLGQHPKTPRVFGVAGRRFLRRQTRTTVCQAASLGIALRGPGVRFLIIRWAERNPRKPEARAEGMRFWIQKTRFPSACASGFKAWALSQSCREAKCEKRAARQRVVRNLIDCSATCVPNRFAIHGPWPANAGDSKSTWAAPKNTEGFRGCRSPLPAAVDLTYGPLAGCARSLPSLPYPRRRVLPSSSGRPPGSIGMLIFR